jgi:hypothetical protein
MDIESERKKDQKSKNLMDEDKQILNIEILYYNDV